MTEALIFTENAASKVLELIQERTVIKSPNYGPINGGRMLRYAIWVYF